MWRTWVLVVVVAAAGCGNGPTPSPSEPPIAIATDIDEALLAPLEGLGPCEADPPEATAQPGDVQGLHLPPDARVTSVTENGPITQVEGWVPLTPIGIRADYARRGDLEVLNVEDEIWESESLVSDGQHRLFVKAQGICRTESVFVALISPEDGSDPQTLGQGG